MTVGIQSTAILLPAEFAVAALNTARFIHHPAPIPLINVARNDAEVFYTARA